MQMLSKDLLNEAYSRLEGKRDEIVRALRAGSFETESGWYNGHYQKNAAGEWIREAYPIPVITVKGLCDIEVQFEQISVSTKLRREDAIAYSFDKLKNYTFEAYGVEDYLSDFYHPGQTIQEFKDNVSAAGESEIGFSFPFPFAADGKRFLEFAKLLGREGFYVSVNSSNV